MCASAWTCTLHMNRRAILIFKLDFSLYFLIIQGRNRACCICVFCYCTRPREKRSHVNFRLRRVSLLSWDVVSAYSSHKEWVARQLTGTDFFLFFFFVLYLARIFSLRKWEQWVLYGFLQCLYSTRLVSSFFFFFSLCLADDFSRIRQELYFCSRVC